jgi:hypothetical protein
MQKNIEFDNTTRLHIKLPRAPFRRPGAYPLIFKKNERVILHFSEFNSNTFGYSDYMSIVGQILEDVNIPLEHIENVGFQVAVDSTASQWVKNVFFGQSEPLHASCAIPKLNSAVHVLAFAQVNFDFTEINFGSTPAVINECAAGSYSQSVRRGLH